MEPQHPPFLPLHPTSYANSTALLHLRRDNVIPVTLQQSSPDAENSTGYAEGHVTNTRFGSYPHSTLLEVLWGSQVRASVVDTGRRGQRKKQQKHQQQQQQQESRLEDEDEDQVPNRSTTPPPVDDLNASSQPLSPRKRTADELPPLQPPAKRHQSIQAPPQAASGFAHLLPLTPEGWTTSLPHRTQVIYTPDYSYIIQRLRIRPGSHVIEAGAGSGSFTHAAARAVYNGKTGDESGKVFSFEYHEPRAKQLSEEIREHGLDRLVRITHRDVYRDGFMLPTDEVEDKSNEGNTTDTTTPNATHILLDLPAPHRALYHLTRTPPTPLNPLLPAHICAFLPCIEQVTAFVAALRKHNFVEIGMAELAHRRLEVRRERVGLDLEGLRGVNASARSVDEAVGRLREVQKRDREFREYSAAREKAAKARREAGHGAAFISEEEDESEERLTREPAETRQARLERIKKEQEGVKSWREGRLVCRTEPEIKSHTSYLVFGVLPREWTEEDERLTRERWKGVKGGDEGRMSKKERKRRRREKEKQGPGGDMKMEGDEEKDDDNDGVKIEQ